MKWNLLSFEVAQRWTATGHACLQPSPCNMSFVLLQWIDAAVAVIQINMACIYYLALPVVSWTSVMMTDQTVGKNFGSLQPQRRQGSGTALFLSARWPLCAFSLASWRKSFWWPAPCCCSAVPGHKHSSRNADNECNYCMSPITEYASKIKLRTNAHLRGCFKILN